MNDTAAKKYSNDAVQQCSSSANCCASNNLPTVGASPKKLALTAPTMPKNTVSAPDSQEDLKPYGEEECHAAVTCDLSRSMIIALQLNVVLAR